jgi:hypothetical protein
LTEDHPKGELPKVRYDHGAALLPTADDYTQAEENAERKAERTSKNEQISLDRRMVFLTGTLAVCTILSLVINSLQIFVANKSADAAYDAVGIASYGLEQNRRNSARQIALAEATTKQAAQSLQANIAQNHLDQRPWVGLGDTRIENGSLDVSHGLYSFDKLDIGIKNTGKTPALSMKVFPFVLTTAYIEEQLPDYDNLDSYQASKLRDTEDRILKDANVTPEMRKSIAESLKKVRSNTIEKTKSTKGGGILPPGVTLIFPRQGGKFAVRENANNIFQRVAIYVFGKITYRDNFEGTPLHTTQFCLVAFRTSGNEGFALCPNGNSMN